MILKNEMGIIRIANTLENIVSSLKINFKYREAVCQSYLQSFSNLGLQISQFNRHLSSGQQPQNCFYFMIKTGFLDLCKTWFETLPKKVSFAELLPRDPITTKSIPFCLLFANFVI